ncbi:MAG: HlyD family efflux transporter periplasmic adaptor subunit [Pseudomonadota bacterium]
MNDQTNIRGRSNADAETKLQNALALLQLDAEIRQISSVPELEFHMVNAAQRLLGFDQAFLFYRAGRRLKLQAASSVVTVEKNAPLIVWLEKTLNRAIAEEAGADALMWLLPKHADGPEASTFPFKGFYWHPFPARRGQAAPGGLLFVRRAPWSARQSSVAEHLIGAYDHALRALTGKRHPGSRGIVRKLVTGAVALSVLVLAFVPVPLTALAPATIVGRDPVIVAAPLDGVIAEVAVRPNQMVQQGDLLFRFEDTELRNAFQIAQQEVAVAEAELTKLRSGSFLDQSAARDIAVAEADAAVAKARADLARQRLDRASVLSTGAGVVIFDNASDLIAQPVAIGEEIMELVDPAQLEVALTIALSDQAVMTMDAPVRIFLDANPLQPVAAEISDLSYRGTLQEDGTVAHNVSAELIDPPEGLALGARGMASVSGEQVPLWYAVLRRPISWLRQTTGL